jgi:phage baseplate assembly protein W
MVARLDKITTSQRSASKVTSRDFMTNFNKHPETDQLIALTNSEAVKRSVRNLILTQRGERFFQPNIGSNIQNILFEPISDYTSDVLKELIIETIKNHEPRAISTDVIIRADEAKNSYNVSIFFYIINNADPVAVNVNLARVR